MMDYKPGLVTASIFKGKTTPGTTNSALASLFSKKCEKKTDKSEKTVLPKAVAKKVKREKANSTVDSLNSEKKEVQKRKRDEPVSVINTKKAKRDSDLQVLGVKSVTKKVKPEKANLTPDSSLGKKKPVQKREKDELTSVTKAKKVKKDSDPLVLGTKKVPPTPSNGFPFVHESLIHKKSRLSQKSKKENKSSGKGDKFNEDDESALPRRRMKRDKTADKRTIFVGNCPLSSDKKVMTKIFREYGLIESMRFRCGPAAQLDIPRRAVIIKKEFHENASSYVCYVVFTEEDSASKALEMNGQVVEGHHLRVDLAANYKKHDKKRSVFVGNLPFSVTEDDLRDHFQNCGEISNVRVIRDRQTSIGKGIAYIQFESKDGVYLAKKLNEREFDGRKLRVMTCMNKPAKAVERRKMRNKTTSKPTPVRPDKPKVSFAPSNRKSSKSFQEVLDAKKEKRLKKKKKMKLGPSQKQDGLSSIFGDMSADIKRLKVENPKLMKGKKDKKDRGKKDKMNKKNDKKIKKVKKKI